jgi:hypothetical protein
MGYFSFGGFQSTQELLYNAPIVNFIVSSLIPFTIVASTNVVIILRVLKRPSSQRLSNVNGSHVSTCNQYVHSCDSSLKPMITTTQITRKDVSYETTITLTTSCVFLTTNSIASIYVYVKSSYRSDRSRLTDDIKASNVYLILRMLTLIDTVLEFYIYFLTGRKFREEVYQVIVEIVQNTPLKHYFKTTRFTATSNRQEQSNISSDQVQHMTRTISNEKSFDNQSWQQYRGVHSHWCDDEETLDRIESTV